MAFTPVVLFKLKGNIQNANFAIFFFFFTQWDLVYAYFNVFLFATVINSSGVHFNSPQVQPTIEQIDMSFGATHPGGW